MNVYSSGVPTIKWSKNFQFRKGFGLSMFGIQLQMLLFPKALCCSLYERNCVWAVTKSFTKFLPANSFRVYTTIYVREAASGKSLSQL